MLEAIKKEGDKVAEKTKKKIGEKLKSGRFISWNDYAIERIKKEIGDVLIAKFSLPADSIKNLRLETPPAHIMADLSLSLFDFAKELKRDPKKMAEESAATVNNPLGHSMFKWLGRAQPAGPYLNLILNKEKIYSLVLSQAGKLKNKYGENGVNAEKTAIIDYSGPNIAKPIGVGHLRSTIIGQALANIYEATGYGVIRDNHLGDWGTQFGKLVYAYRQWGDKKKIAENPIKELNELYVKFHEEAEKNPEIEDIAREIFQKMEEGDSELIKLWMKFRSISIAEFKKVYERLGIKFDMYLGESYFAGETDKIVKECLEKKLAKKDEETGAIAVEDLEGLPSFLLRKKDDSGLYITRDFIDGAKAKHIGFGLVLSGGEKMSTRKGTLIELEELIKQSVEKSKEILRQKNKDLSEKEIEEISEIIGLGAVVYNDLRQSRQKNISFDWKRMLDFEGGSAVYLQYTVARINSILKKLNAGEIEEKIFKLVFEKESEFALARKMMFFPVVILEAQKHNSPHLIAVYLEELAQLFNHFYNEVSIIGTEDANLRLSRISLIKSVATVIKNGLKLLGVKTPEKI
ncbi:MAG: arginyl-tRNA ligase [Candidatus Collierbacteria bacterium GW2011_GWA2_44_99]|uniref:arginine--tRNA ligase n=1 Tax=Candidatus Collierbacteria bacterium GW2011_GWA2_44_99 TaxID=1618380 RepID=A0A0G1KMA6_9BACT|nr:MAG: arginyl-tRNA ligase [Candidatus Collierbacteria bacterium GW2011_GWA2_44_99]